MPSKDQKTDRSRAPLTSPRSYQLVLIFGFWSAIGLLYGGALLVETESERMGHSSARILLYQILYWNLWTCLTPLILWLGKRYPLEQSTWKRSLPVHLLSFAAVMPVHALAATSLMMTMKPFGDMSNKSPFLSQFKSRLLGGSTFGIIVYGGILGAGYAVDYYRKYRDREMQTSQLKAQLVQPQHQRRFHV